MTNKQPVEMPTHLDNLKQKRGLIDLDGNSEGFFGLGEYILEKVLDDIILVEFIDEISDGQGDAVERNGIFIPTNTLTKAWRKGKVLIVGPTVNYCNVGDIVIFPNDKGASVSRLDVRLADGTKYLVSKGMFLNEQRIFGICSKQEQESANINANRKRRSKNTTA
jgi:co-chaperonin GroES (HSP10)